MGASGHRRYPTPSGFTSSTSCRLLMLATVVVLVVIWRGSELARLGNDDSSQRKDFKRRPNKNSVVGDGGHSVISPTTAKVERISKKKATVAPSIGGSVTNEVEKARTDVVPSSSDEESPPPPAPTHRAMSSFEAIVEDLENIVRQSTMVKDEGKEGDGSMLVERFSLGRQTEAAHRSVGAPLSVLCILEGRFDATGTPQQDCGRYFESAHFTKPGRGDFPDRYHAVSLVYLKDENDLLLAQRRKELDNHHQGSVDKGVDRENTKKKKDRREEEEFDFVKHSAMAANEPSNLMGKIFEQMTKMHKLAMKSLHGKVEQLIFAKEILESLRGGVNGRGDKKKEEKGSVTTEAKKLDRPSLGPCLQANGLSIDILSSAPTENKLFVGATVISAARLSKIYQEGGPKRLRRVFLNSVLTYVLLTPSGTVGKSRISDGRNFDFLNMIASIMNAKESIAARGKVDQFADGNDGDGVPADAFDPVPDESELNRACRYQVLSAWHDVDVQHAKAGFSPQGGVVVRFSCEGTKESSAALLRSCADEIFGGKDPALDLETASKYKVQDGDQKSASEISSLSLSSPTRLLCNNLKKSEPHVESVIKLGTKTAIYKGTYQKKPVIWKQFDPLQYSTFLDYRKFAASPHKLSPLINHPSMSCLHVVNEKSDTREHIEGGKDDEEENDHSLTTNLLEKGSAYVWQAQPFVQSAGNLKQFLEGSRGKLALKSWGKRIALAISITCIFNYLHSHPSGVFTYDDNHPEQYLVHEEPSGEMKLTLIDIDTLQLAKSPKNFSPETGGDTVAISKGRNLKEFKTRCRCFFCHGRSNCLFINTVKGLKDCDQWTQGESAKEKFRPVETTPKKCDASSDLHFMAQIFMYLVKPHGPWSGKGIHDVVSKYKEGQYPNPKSGDEEFDALVQGMFRYANEDQKDGSEGDNGDEVIPNTAVVLEKLGALCAKHSKDCNVEPSCPALLNNPKSSKYMDVLQLPIAS